MGAGRVTPGTEMRGTPSVDAGRRGTPTRRGGSAKGSDQVRRGGRTGAPGGRTPFGRMMPVPTVPCFRKAEFRPGFGLRGRSGGSVTTMSFAATMTSRRTADSAGRSRRSTAR